MDTMEIYFEAGGQFITAKDKGRVQVRCGSWMTDIADDESLVHFVLRHGGERQTANYLAQCYREAA